MRITGAHRREIKCWRRKGIGRIQSTVPPSTPCHTATAVSRFEQRPTLNHRTRPALFNITAAITHRPARITNLVAPTTKPRTSHPGLCRDIINRRPAAYFPAARFIRTMTFVVPFVSNFTGRASLPGSPAHQTSSSPFNS